MANIDPSKQVGKRVKAQPYDENKHNLSAVMLPVYDLITNELTGYIPLAYILDSDGRAILKVTTV